MSYEDQQSIYQQVYEDGHMIVLRRIADDSSVTEWSLPVVYKEIEFKDKSGGVPRIGDIIRSNDVEAILAAFRGPIELLPSDLIVDGPQTYSIIDISVVQSNNVIVFWKLQLRLWSRYGLSAQELIYEEFERIAKNIGTPFTVYRASSQNNPVSPENMVNSSLMALLHQDESFDRPSRYGNAIWRGMLDGNDVEVGDYLVSDLGQTLFVNGKPNLLPVTLVECNSTISIYRPTHPVGKGAIGYGGNTSATEVELAKNWPVSQLQGSIQERNRVGLPSDVILPGWIILIPQIPGIEILTSDVIVDQYNRRSVINSYELTSFGWRIQAGLATS